LIASPYIELAVNNAKETERLEFNAAQLSHGSAHYNHDTIDTYSLGITHNNTDVATGGMDDVKTPSIKFPDIESNHHITNNTAFNSHKEVVVMGSAIKYSNSNSDSNIHLESCTTPATVDADLDIASNDPPVIDFAPQEVNLTGNTNLVTKLPATQLKPTSPLVVVASTGLPTVPDAIAAAIALNQQLAIKAITAHQKLYPKKLKKKHLLL